MCAVKSAERAFGSVDRRSCAFKNTQIVTFAGRRLEEDA